MGGQGKDASQEGNRKQWIKKLECFICGDEYYASSGHHQKNITNKEQLSKEEEEEGFVNAACEANAFHTICTYQVNAIGFKAFSQISPISQLWDLRF
jgi:hypothetical protein